MSLDSRDTITCGWLAVSHVIIMDSERTLPSFYNIDGHVDNKEQSWGQPPAGLGQTLSVSSQPTGGLMFLVTPSLSSLHEGEIACSLHL